MASFAMSPAWAGEKAEEEDEPAAWAEEDRGCASGGVRRGYEATGGGGMLYRVSEHVRWHGARLCAVQ